ncbi:MAG: hypothetical protein PHS34_08865 [Candidatus Omnitrophica bacterium]|nr:hypothetical protein [Candidatus Omnitrophota bacterium]MDD5551357.1 hypothetical protein [Candidatus Omnitrophota bacterium]
MYKIIGSWSSGILNPINIDGTYRQALLRARKACEWMMRQPNSMHGSVAIISDIIPDDQDSVVYVYDDHRGYNNRKIKRIKIKSSMR